MELMLQTRPYKYAYIMWERRCGENAPRKPPTQLLKPPKGSRGDSVVGERSLMNEIFLHQVQHHAKYNMLQGCVVATHVHLHAEVERLPA